MAQDRCSDYDPTETPESELTRPDGPALAHALEGHIKTWVAVRREGVNGPAALLPRRQLSTSGFGRRPEGLSSTR